MASYYIIISTEIHKKEKKTKKTSFSFIIKALSYIIADGNLIFVTNNSNCPQFLEKEDLILHVKCLPSRQFTLNVKCYVLWKITKRKQKKFMLLSAAAVIALEELVFTLRFLLCEGSAPNMLAPPQYLFSIMWKDPPIFTQPYLQNFSVF